MTNKTICSLLLLLVVVSETSARYAGLSKRQRMANGRLPYNRQLPSIHGRRGVQSISVDPDYDFNAPKHNQPQYKRLGEDYSSRKGYQSNLNQLQYPNYDEKEVDPKVIRLIEALVTHESWDWYALRKFMESARANMDDYTDEEFSIAPEAQAVTYEDSAPPIIAFSNNIGRIPPPRQNAQGESRDNKTEMCAQHDHETWNDRHVLVCDETVVTVAPTTIVTFGSETHRLTDKEGQLVEVVQGQYGGERYDQKVDIHWCVRERTSCKGVFGNSECQMEDSVHWLHYRKTGGDGYSGIQFGGVKIPTYCSCMLVP